MHSRRASKLPPITLDRSLYVEVKKALDGIGGKWVGGKTQGFVFKQDPTELLSVISGGAKINLKKDFQFFGTPDNLADEIVVHACIHDHHTLLEPSAGQGALVNAARRVCRAPVFCYELMPQNQEILKKVDGVVFLGEDFLDSDDTQYDRIIANPPFTKNQDIDHTLRMYEKLKLGGRMVVINSTHWATSNNFKESTYREWLEKVGAKIIAIEKGTFKESGTMVGAVIIIIDKE